MKVTVHWSLAQRHRVLRYAQTMFLLVGCVAVGLCALLYFETGVFQAFQSWRFDKALSSPGEELKGPSATDQIPSLRLLAHEGSPLGRIEIPRIGLSVMFAEGIEPLTLSLAAGHIPGTPFPDESGNVGIAAHRDLFFRSLRKIRRDDVIVMTTLRGTSEYSVEWTRVVKPKDVYVLGDSSQPMLTLVTCYPFYYVGPAPERFIVRARRIDVEGL